MNVLLWTVLTVVFSNGGVALTPLEPNAETGSYAGQALDVQKISGVLGLSIRA